MIEAVTRSGLLGRLQALWVYRRFILSMVAREFHSRYLGSILGVVWAVLTPLATILIYLVVFSAVMRGRLPGAGDPLSFGIYLCTGILVWGFFAEVVGRCQTVFIDSANLIKKMSFPRSTLPVIVVLTALTNFAVVAALFVALLLVVGRFPGAPLLGFIPLLLVQQAFATGIGVLLGTLHVFFRDVGQLWAVMLNLWFWGTPIVYHVDILPERVAAVIAWNPLTPLFGGYQRIVVEGAWPEWADLGYPAVVAAVAMALGLFAFKRLSWEMVDEL